MNRISRRQALGAGAFLTLLVALPALAQDAQFPFSYTHAYGETIVPSKPQRVLALSYGGTGLAQAAGAHIVGAWRNATTPDGSDPWLLPYAEDTKILGLSSDYLLNFEEIAALEPDLILAIDTQTRIKLAEEFPRLNSIAPTIVPVPGDRLATYQIVGEALGEPEAIDNLIKRVDDRIAGIKAQHAGDVPRTVAYGQIRVDEVAVQVDPTLASSVQLFQALGFEPPAEIVADYSASAARTPGTVPYSWETASVLNSADIVIMGLNGISIEELRANPLFARIEAELGDKLHLIPIDLLTAIQLYGPYNADWILDRIEPMLATDE